MHFCLSDAVPVHSVTLTGVCETCAAVRLSVAVVETKDILVLSVTGHLWLLPFVPSIARCFNTGPDIPNALMG